MLLVAAVLLMMFVTGRLDWLTRLQRDTAAVRDQAQGADPDQAEAVAAATAGVRHPSRTRSPGTRGVSA